MTEKKKKNLINAAEGNSRLEKPTVDEEKTDDGNREYKSDLFSLLMSEKKYALEVYNAVNGSSYDDPEMIEIITLEHGVSLSVRNDAAFILDMNVNYYEHQSSYNPNMPLRYLIYYATDIKKKINKERKNLFGRTLINIPTPHFVVFYNGKEKRPEVEFNKLSDSFEKRTENPELDLTVTTYNINPGFNEDMMNKSEVLTGYTYLVECVRILEKIYELKTAIAKAIDECIEKGYLKEFLIEHRSEVEKNMVLDFTFEKQLELTREEERELGRREGVEQGIKQERINTEQAEMKAEQEKKRADALEEEVRKLKEMLNMN